jgi:hypothetical protein
MDPRARKPAEIELPAMDPRVGDGGPTSNAVTPAFLASNKSPDKSRVFSKLSR